MSGAHRGRRRPRLRPPWLVAGVVLTVFSIVLVVAGFAGAEVGNDHSAHDPVANNEVPPSVVDGGPIVDIRQGGPQSTWMPTQTIALTFDDGPDPTWTPQVLAVLHKHHVPGTFFVVGARASRSPGLIKDIQQSGSELGVHTFTHPDLIDVSPWRFGRELTETQLTLAGAAGVTTRLMRPPYSSTTGAIDDLGYKTVRTAAGMGYTSVFTDVDSEDWQRPGVQKIIDNATPSGKGGAVVLMHDAGGDRSETVAALDRLIPLLQQRGYRFTTVSEGAGLRAGNVSATARERGSGEILLGIAQVSLGIVQLLQWILIGVGALVVARLVLMVAVARRHAIRRHDPTWGWGPPVTEPVTVIVPAYNERENIEATLRSILANDHPLEVIVVDDGSTDGTAEIVERLAFDRVRLIRQPNGGKTSALNTGIAAARHELILMMDGDTVFERDTVHQIVQPFADSAVGAVAGNVKVANRATILGRLQHIEYVIGFNVDRRVHDIAGTMLTIPGAAGAFRRRALIDVNGLSHDTLAEDTDLTIAIGRVGWRVVYEDTAIAWTEAPSTVKQLWQQRYRWTYGTMQALWKHRAALREPGHAGRLGRFGLLHIVLFQILLPLSAPAIDVFFVYGLFFLDPGTTLLMWSAVMLIQIGAAWFAFRWDGEPRGTLWMMPLQQIVYRQLMYVVLVQSVITALSGARVRWQKLARVGGLEQLLAAFPLRPGGTASAQLAAEATRTASADGLPAPVGAPSGGPGTATEIPAETVPVRPLGKASAPSRERWLDVLRAVALCRVVAYHVFGYGWLSWIFPSMGVMFALGGSLMVASIRRKPAIDVIGDRLRRLLPPLWLLGAILIPVMLWYGWSTDSGDSPLHPVALALWVFPVLDPPGSAWASDATIVLWYVRAYLWFVILTPVLLRAFRRRPLVALAVPILLLALNAVLGSPLRNGDSVSAAVLDFATFAACWMLGFAHRDGTLRRLRTRAAIGTAALLIGLGGYWAITHGSPRHGFDLNDIPLAQALVSIGVVLVVLRVAPRLEWLDRVPVLGRFVRVVNARAISIYLWHNIAIDVAQPINDWIGWSTQPELLVTTIVLTAVAVFAFGWVEDLAARRRVRILPGRLEQRRAPVPVPEHV